METAIERQSVVRAFPQQSKAESAMDIATTRQAQEVQAAMVIARRFPRDQEAAYNRIMVACRRTKLAEGAMYSYPRGDKTVTGPSIRLAEAIAQAWGNLDFGIIELEQKHLESVVMSYAWDLESNTRETKVFTVKHQRRVGKGDAGRVIDLTDPRDIYEMTANQGARRLRACVLGIIPGDIVDAALVECEKTLGTSGGEPIIDRVRKMIAAFGEIGVSQKMIEEKVKHAAADINQSELVELRKIYTSLRDNVASLYDFFPNKNQEQNGKTKDSLDALKEKFAPAKPEEEVPGFGVAEVQDVSAPVPVNPEPTPREFIGEPALQTPAPDYFDPRQQARRSATPPPAQAKVAPVETPTSPTTPPTPTAARRGRKPANGGGGQDWPARQPEQKSDDGEFLGMQVDTETGEVIS
jgi:hypothetical protein